MSSGFDEYERRLRRLRGEGSKKSMEDHLYHLDMMLEASKHENSSHFWFRNIEGRGPATEALCTAFGKPGADKVALVTGFMRMNFDNIPKRFQNAKYEKALSMITHCRVSSSLDFIKRFNNKRHENSMIGVA